MDDETEERDEVDTRRDRPELTLRCCFPALLAVAEVRDDGNGRRGVAVKGDSDDNVSATGGNGV